MIYLTLFLNFFKIGLFTFGGGYAMLPLIEQVVISHQWIEEKQLIDFIAVSESTPGPFAVNISTYVGSRVGGVFGALCATLGVILPSFLVIWIISSFYLKFKENRYVNGCMQGLRPAVTGLIGAAVLSVGGKVFAVEHLWKKENLVMAVIVAVAGVMAYKKTHPIFIICISGLLGIVASLLLGLS